MPTGRYKAIPVSVAPVVYSFRVPEKYPIRRPMPNPTLPIGSQPINNHTISSVRAWSMASTRFR